MLGLDLLSGSFVHLALHRGYLVSQLSDLALESLDLGLQIVRVGSGPLHLRALESELLLETVNLPLSLSFGLLDGHELAIDLLVLRLHVEASFDLGFDLERLLLEQAELLKEFGVVLGQVFVLNRQLLVVSLLPLELLLLVVHLLFHFVLLKLQPHGPFDLSFVRLPKCLELRLEGSQLQQLSFKSKLFFFNLIDFLLLLSQFL